MQRPFQPAHLTHPLVMVTGWLFWLLIFLILIVAIAQETMPEHAIRTGVVGLGVLGIWRYGWAMTHLVRALAYRILVWPRLRRAADATAAITPAPPLAIVVTAYQMPEAVLTSAFCALMGAAADYPAAVTLVMALTDSREQDQLMALYERLGAPPQVQLRLMVQDGRGKRPALAQALRQVQGLPGAEHGLVALMDGDTLLRPESLQGLLGLFASQPKLGAVTVHNTSWSDGGLLTQEWHSLRMAQRHIMMQSQALARRVLVLTGRFSVFRGCIATDPAFIACIANDTLDHWRYGAVPFLTGDDKSTWFHVLKGGWEMRYLPDVVVDCIEPVVAERFIPHSLPLLRRWSGNMLRNVGRARQLGPRRMPLFTWWSLVDQGLSMWTALLAPVGYLLLACTHSAAWGWLYAVWVLVTRTGYAALIGMGVGRLSPWWPFLLFYNQIVGAFLKINTLFRLPRQSWTRQRLIRPVAGNATVLLRQYRLATVFEVTAWLIFGWFSLLLAGLAPLPFTLS